MSTPPEEIVVECPKCKHRFETWYRASMNLALDDFDEDYIREATVKTCPKCKKVIKLHSLIVEEDGPDKVWKMRYT